MVVSISTIHQVAVMRNLQGDCQLSSRSCSTAASNEYLIHTMLSINSKADYKEVKRISEASNEILYSKKSGKYLRF